MTQTFFDKNNQSFFFNTNETICLNQGLIYKDLCGNLFDTNNTILHKDSIIKWEWI